jgi:hypothetical protein
MVGEKGYSVRKCSEYFNRTKKTKWAPATVLKMLKNTTYKGQFKIMGKILDVPPIIDKELFDIIPQKTKANHLFSSNGNKHFNALKGLFHCACGCSLYLHKTGVMVKGGYYFHYTCYSKKASNLKTPCKNNGIEATFVNKIAWNLTQKYINLDDFKEKTIEQKNLINNDIEYISERIIKFQSNIDELNEKIERLTDTIETTAASAVVLTLTKRISQHDSDIKKMNSAIEKLERELRIQNIKLKDLAASLLPSLVNNISTEEKSEIMQRYIETITYYSVNTHRGFLHFLFKNGIENIVVTKTQPFQEAFEFPFEGKINIDKRTLTVKHQEPFILPESTKKQYRPTFHTYTHDEILKRYRMEEFMIDLTPPTNQADQPLA